MRSALAIAGGLVILGGALAWSLRGDPSTAQPGHHDAPAAPAREAETTVADVGSEPDPTHGSAQAEATDASGADPPAVDRTPHPEVERILELTERSPERAEFELLKLINREPKDGRLWRLLAEVLRRLGRDAEALRAEARAAKLGAVEFVDHVASGWVLGPGGTKVGSAEVWVHLPLETYTPARFQANVEGWFEAPYRAPARGGVFLEARALGYAPSPHLLVKTGEPGPHELRLRAEAGFEVHVRAAGSERPVAGASVSCDGAGEATTDSEGVARLRELAEGLQHVRVRAPGYLTWRERLALRGGSLTQQTVLLRRAATLTGVVRDAEGSPIVGAQVSLDERSTKTNETGIYRFVDHPLGSYTLKIRLAGGLGYLGAVELTGDQRFDPPLEPDAKLVVDFGEPVRGWRSVRVEWPSGHVVSLMAQGGEQTVQSGLVPGRVVLSGEGGRLQRVLRPGETTRVRWPADLTDGALTRGQVTLANGSPATARVRVYDDHARRVAHAKADANGAFTLRGFEPRGYFVHATAGNQAWLGEAVLAEDLQLKLAPQATLELVVRDPGGNQLGGIPLTLRHATGVERKSGWVQAEEPTRLKKLVAGRYRLELSAPHLTHEAIRRGFDDLTVDAQELDLQPGEIRKLTLVAR